MCLLCICMVIFWSDSSIFASFLILISGSFAFFSS